MNLKFGRTTFSFTLFLFIPLTILTIQIYCHNKTLGQIMITTMSFFKFHTTLIFLTPITPTKETHYVI